MLEFTKEEQDVMAKFSCAHGWGAKEVEEIKTKIRNNFIFDGIAQCCYCRRAMKGQHKKDIDTEHVLPKELFHQFTFELRNLNIACKRCNMGIKRADTSFFLGGEECQDHFLSEHYSIVHPNLDNPKEHLSIKWEQNDDDLIITYKVLNESAKGWATYKYFKLSNLVRDSILKAQGEDVANTELTPENADELETILEPEQSGSEIADH